MYNIQCCDCAVLVYSSRSFLVFRLEAMLLFKIVAAFQVLAIIFITNYFYASLIKINCVWNAAFKAFIWILTRLTIVYIVPDWLLGANIPKWPFLSSSSNNNNNQIETDYKPTNQQLTNTQAADPNLQNLLLVSNPIGIDTTAVIDATTEHTSTTDISFTQTPLDYFEDVVTDSNNLPEGLPIVFSDFSPTVNSSTSSNNISTSSNPVNNQWRWFYLYLKNLLNCTLPHNTFC